MRRLLHSLLLAAAAAALSPGAAGAEPQLQWLCQAEQSTGFVFEEGAWRARHFDAAAKAWVFSAHEVPDFSHAKDEGTQAPRDASEELPTRLVYSLSRPNATWPILQCNAKEVFDVIQCELGETAFASKRLFRFNPLNDRFMLIAPNGYVETQDAQAPPSEITIGKCQLM
jgi:Xaa-Pro aminopeptidase